jgi:hypothetical protein
LVPVLPECEVMVVAVAVQVPESDSCEAEEATGPLEDDSA